MKFSDSEMMFMISVSRGRKPLGIDIKIPEDSQREEYIKDAIYSLRNKNIVDENLKLTKEGADLFFSLKHIETATGMLHWIRYMQRCCPGIV